MEAPPQGAVVRHQAVKEGRARCQHGAEKSAAHRAASGCHRRTLRLPLGIYTAMPSIFTIPTQSDVPSTGYWGKATAVHQFCEPKYATSPYVAEFYNSISSFLYVFAACYALFWQLASSLWIYWHAGLRRQVAACMCTYHICMRARLPPARPRRGCSRARARAHTCMACAHARGAG